MAEAVLFNVAEGIIAKLGSQVLNEIKLWWGVKDELEKLNTTVSTIKAVLLHAEEQSTDSPQVKNWVGMLSDAMYDADDLLDEFSTHALRQQVMTGSKIAKEVRLFFSSSNQIAYGLKMAHKIKAIRDRLDEIAANRRFYLEARIREAPITTRLGREQTHSSPPLIVVGREHDKEAIIELLLSSNCDENVSVVPVVGIGGLGKTTLAQLVCDDEKVKIHFELKLWTCVSDNFDVKSIVVKILESATKEKPNNSEMEALKNLLQKEINGKKFLLVLDDVWNEESNRWFNLRDLLEGGAKGSKILITTCLRKVAEMTRPISIYELKGLSEVESWSLFKQIAFKRGHVPGPNYEAIGKEIVAKCSGVPLAIRTIGGLLYFKEMESDWVSFKNKELLKIDGYKNDIISILKLSYNHLPSHYKHCFAYCSLFPKDYQFEVYELVRLWIAQGYVKLSDQNECAGDVGLGYFMDLLRMSFFQEVKRDIFDDIKTFKMHDLMHDLAISVAGEYFVTANFKSSSINDKTRHISVEVDGDSVLQALPSLLKAKKLRTLIPFVENGICIREKECHAMFLNLRGLRVLDLSFLGIKTLPSSICRLKHLRHLDLSGNRDIKRLPDSITALQNLQELKLSFCVGLIELPKDIKTLANLMSLDNYQCNELTHMPRGIGKLTRLEKLSTFVIAKDSSVSKHSGGLDELHALNNLRGELEIMNLRYVKNFAFEFKQANLKEKQHLRELSLYWNNYGEHEDGYCPNDETELEELRPHQNLKSLTLSSYKGAKFPSWLPSLANLVSICFQNCKSINYIPPFDHLPSLKRLRISTSTDLERIELSDGGSASFFPSLTDLRLSECPNLKGFFRCKSTDAGTLSSSAELPCFPCLSLLEIGFCPNLICMPLFPSLEKLMLRQDGIKSLNNILGKTTAVSQSCSSSPFSALSQLKTLEILNMEDFPAQELLSNLKSLEELRFVFCPMKTLSIGEMDNGLQWQSLKSLRRFSMQRMLNLESLPLGLQYASTLQRLRIFECPNLISLPEWMPKLSALQHLIINRSPQLSERCKNNIAEDWPKISHIPNIEIDYQIIQRNGCYQR